MSDNLFILSDKQQYYTWEEQQDAVMKEISGIDSNGLRMLRQSLEEEELLEECFAG